VFRVKKHCCLLLLTQVLHFLTEMLKGVFFDIKNKFQAAVDILRKEKITLDPEDPAAVKQYANVMKTIRQK